MPRFASSPTACALALTAAVLLTTGCGKKEATAKPPGPATGAVPNEQEATPTPAGAAAKAGEPTADAGAAEPDAAANKADAAAPTAQAPSPEPKVDPRKNAWNLKGKPGVAKVGDRVYLLTRGRDRSHTNQRAVYHLYAYDVKGVAKDVVTLKELGGGDFQASTAFLVPAGVAKAKDLKKGDMVLAEWASSLKHATVIGFAGDKVKIRYTDLPDSWSEEKVTALKAPRELTLQREGFSAGNFAVAALDGQQYLVMLVAQAGDEWLVRRFAGRVTTVAKDKLTPMPLKPKLRPRSKVLVPWVGMMYRGTVKKVRGARAWVQVAGIGQKAPVIIPLGQILPAPKK